MTKAYFSKFCSAEIYWRKYMNRSLSITKNKVIYVVQVWNNNWNIFLDNIEQFRQKEQYTPECFKDLISASLIGNERVEFADKSAEIH